MPAFEAVLTEWATQALGKADRQLVIDGKALRGLHGEELPGVRLVALYAPEAGLGDRRKRGVRTKEEQAETEEEREQAKQEAELSVAPRLLWQASEAIGVLLVCADALDRQRILCRQIRQAGGDYLFAVKANQPTLLEDVTLRFTDPPPGERFLTAHPVDKHAGRLEVRRVRASAALSPYLQAAGWEGAGLVLEVEAVVRWPMQPDGPPGMRFGTS